MSAVPGPVYGLEVPPGEILIPAAMEFPASVSFCSSPLALSNLMLRLPAAVPSAPTLASARRQLPMTAVHTYRICLLTANITVPHHHGCCRSH